MIRRMQPVFLGVVTQGSQNHAKVLLRQQGCKLGKSSAV